MGYWKSLTQSIDKDYAEYCCLKPEINQLTHVLAEVSCLLLGFSQIKCVVQSRINSLASLKFSLANAPELNEIAWWEWLLVFPALFKYMKNGTVDHDYVIDAMKIQADADAVMLKNKVADINNRIDAVFDKSQTPEMDRLNKETLDEINGLSSFKFEIEAEPKLPRYKIMKSNNEDAARKAMAAQAEHDAAIVKKDVDKIKEQVVKWFATYKATNKKVCSNPEKLYNDVEIINQQIKSFFTLRANMPYQFIIAKTAVGLLAMHTAGIFAGKNEKEHNEKEFREFVDKVKVEAKLPENVMTTINNYQVNPPTLEQAVAEVRKLPEFLSREQFIDDIKEAGGNEKGEYPECIGYLVERWKLEWQKDN